MIWLENTKMKVYSISKWAFYVICVLILSLPLSRHWKLLTLGEKAEGTVKEYKMIVHKNIAGEHEIHYVSEIHFQTKDSSCIAFGPPDWEYKAERKIRLKYDPDDPSRNCLLTFSYIYLNDYVILPLILLIVWAAFYLSFNSYSKKSRSTKNRDLAFSPYKSRKQNRKPGSKHRGRAKGIQASWLPPLLAAFSLMYSCGGPAPDSKKSAETDAKVEIRYRLSVLNENLK